MVLMVLPRAISRLLEMSISHQRELVYSFSGLLIFRYISETAYIWLSQEGYERCGDTTGKPQRGGLKRHLPALQDCHSTPALQPTLSFSHRVFKPSAEDKRESGPWELCHIQHSSNQTTAFSAFSWVMDN